jgi:uncharacterized protein (DUF169 family)
VLACSANFDVAPVAPDEVRSLLMNTLAQTALIDLNLAHRPVAIAFLSTPPANLARIERAAAAGCAYWKHASDGHAFYTTVEDHFNCPVGAYTHGADLPAATANELQGLVGTMVQLRYVRADEVPQIPRRTEPLQIAAYAPLADASFTADVVIFRGNARQVMLLSEAARAVGAFAEGTAMGRPACAAIPQALASSGGVASIGCIGNRVYTMLGDDELYLIVPGSVVEQMLSELPTIVAANAELERFHRARA